jgi:predicted alpha-1,2-mannosidase
MTFKFYSLITFFSVYGCLNPSKDLPKESLNLLLYVNPFIGTGGHGHTFPGATRPFGMMQLSPDTRLDGWDGCSGYHYSDSYIYGFSHTHLSGTGVSDYGDILLMPSNKVIFNNGSDGQEGYKAHFSHENEIAKPGYYKVTLDQINVDVELTVSKRSGLHKYQYESSENQFLILDLTHRDQLLDYKIQKIDAYSLSGYRHSKAWAENQQLFYYIEFSHPIKEINYELSDEVIGPKNYKFESKKAAIEFDNPSNTPVSVKIGISAVDENGAEQNLNEEIKGFDFETLKKEAQDEWNTKLNKISVTSKDTDYKTNFYTALYHTMIAPNLYQDVDGRYRGMDQEIHQTKAFEYYTVFSLWDTYRAAHPLFTLLEVQKTNDFINTFLAKFDEGGILPIWDLSASYTGCMIGYHAVSVIADAFMKGIREYDAYKALKAMQHSAQQDKLGLEDYKSLGYISMEHESESVSKTIEYAYDDWALAQMAKELGASEVYKTYIQRAQNYKNVFDPQTQFMRGRFRNTWFAPFNPYEVNFNYTEANAWQYSNYVPQDFSGYINLLGSKAQFEKNLDTLFLAPPETTGREQADITGLIGQYAHGNEPSHHMAYLYNFVNKPYKTQEKVHEILTTLYTNTPDGISGNEDCGQMSAWYVFSALGFYPVTPASNTYIIGKPLFDSATIHLENQNTFSIKSYDLSTSNRYIASVKLNGVLLDRSFLYHSEIINGGELEFFMTDKPSDWGTEKGAEPITSIDDYLIVPAPFIFEGNVAFKTKTSIRLGNADPKATIYFKIDDSTYQPYRQPIEITEAGTLYVYAEKNKFKSAVISTEFFKIDPTINIKLETNFANQYNAGGNEALIDGILGTADFRTGTWQGYFNEDLVAIVDLGRQKSINLVSINFLRDQRSWIFYPSKVVCYGSKDGIDFQPIDTIELEPPSPSDEIEIKTIEFKTNKNQYQYIKLIAKTYGTLPSWHLGFPHDGKSWLFADEISIN